MGQQECAIEQLFPGNSETTVLARAIDWSATPLGSIATWPQSLRTALNICLNCPFPMAIWWGSKWVSFGNDACRSLFGAKLLFGQPGCKSDPNLWSEIGPALDEILATGDAIASDDRRPISANGTDYVTASHNPIFDEAGRIGGICTTFTKVAECDRSSVTTAVARQAIEQKRARAKLRESQYFIQRIAQTVPGILYVYDTIERRNVYVNGQIATLLGYTEEWVKEMGTNLITSLIHPEDLALVPDHLKQFQSARDGEIFELTYRMRRADGEWRWFHDREVAFSRSPDGSLRQILGIVQDITEAKRREDDLRESEERFRLVTCAVNGLVFDWDLVADEVYRSEQLYEIVGVRPADAPPSAMWWRDRLHPDDKDRFQEEMPQLFASTDTLRESQYRVRHEDGHWVNVWERCCLIRDEENAVIRIVGCTMDISDRVAAEAALLENDRLLRLALSGANAGLWDWEIPTGQMIWSPENYDLLGIDRGNVLRYENWYDVLYPQDREQASAEVARMLAEREPNFRLEYRVVHPYRGMRWLLALGRLSFDERGEPQRLSGINIDITERKEAELERDKLVSLIENSPDFIGIASLDGQGMYLNRAGQNLVGLHSLEEVQQRQIWEFIFPEDREFVRERILPTVLARGQWQGEFRFRHFQTGEAIWVWWNAFVIRDPLTGQPTEFATVTRDIRERKQSEEALRQSEERFRQMAETISDIFWMMDLEREQVLYVSPAFDRIWGRSREELYQTWGIGYHYIHPDDRERVAEITAKGIENRGFEMEYRIVRPDGTIRHLRDRGFLVADERGKFTRMLGVAQDITLAKGLETARLQAERQLQDRAAELREVNATLELTTARLRDRNKELDRFVYTVSHDLKAPLRAVSNLAGWLADDLEDQLEGENLLHLQLLQGRVARMVSLIDGLLVYSRIGRTEVATETVKVEELIAEILDSLQPPDSFKFEIEVAIAPFATKRLLLSQVLSNLISNAIKYHDRPDGRIAIKVVRAGDFYEFAIADNGPGIAPEYHERIFEIFQTIE